MQNNENTEPIESYGRVLRSDSMKVAKPLKILDVSNPIELADFLRNVEKSERDGTPKAKPRALRDIQNIRNYPFACPYCSRTYEENGSKFRRHQRSHTTPKPHACPYEGCNKSFTLRSNLRTHMMIHSDVRQFLCGVEGCGKGFVQHNNLKLHLIAHSEGRVKIEIPLKEEPIVEKELEPEQLNGENVQFDADSLNDLIFANILDIEYCNGPIIQIP